MIVGQHLNHGPEVNAWFILPWQHLLLNSLSSCEVSSSSSTKDLRDPVHIIPRGYCLSL